ncbi:MAG: histidine--tRNA ligase [bacterium]|nr:histidine--tRNA ligase [bacterium]
MKESKKVNIPTKALAGFMELLPAEQILFDNMKDTIQQSYERFGFVPLDTPVIERAAVLLAKAGGETEKQIYRFQKGDNDLALRFDLTIPLARYVSEHFSDLTFPFRRYAIGKVYRGERNQRGRYKEFYQCDIDIIGNGKLALINDAEIPSIIYTTFKALDFGEFTIKINNRKALNGLFDFLGPADRASGILREIDKIEKIGEEKVRQELTKQGVEGDVLERILGFINIKGTNDEVIQQLRKLDIDHEGFRLGVEELAEVTKYIRYLGVPEKNFKVDLSIARGLDYYTGTVYETMLDEHPEVGSVCSGGRYDNLAEYYTNRQLPGVGISIGLTRLFFQLQDKKIINAGASAKTQVMVIPFMDDLQPPLELADRLRKENVNTEIYFEKAKVLKIFKYAEKLGIPYVAIVGEDEVKEGCYSLKNIATRDQVKVTFEELLATIRKG